MNDASYHLEVSNRELTNALRQITMFKKRAGRREMMMLSSDGKRLRFTMSCVSVGVSARGTWQSDVLAPAASIYGVARVPINEETVRIIVDGDWLKIGSSAMRVERGAC